jgi:hypothetical protein
MNPSPIFVSTWRLGCESSRHILLVFLETGWACGGTIVNSKLYPWAYPESIELNTLSMARRPEIASLQCSHKIGCSRVTFCPQTGFVPVSELGLEFPSFCRQTGF